MIQTPKLGAIDRRYDPAIVSSLTYLAISWLESAVMRRR
jgi:hypothetical protein